MEYILTSLNIVRLQDQLIFTIGNTIELKIVASRTKRGPKIQTVTFPVKINDGR